MSRYDYLDPSLDSDRCDGLSDPEREQPREWLCDECGGAGTLTLETGDDGHLDTHECHGCHGAGVVKEEM